MQDAVQETLTGKYCPKYWHAATNRKVKKKREWTTQQNEDTK